MGKRKTAGVVLCVTDCRPDLPETITIRPIRDKFDELPAIPPDLLKLCRWVSTYYFYPLGEVFDPYCLWDWLELVAHALSGPRISSFA